MIDLDRQVEFDKDLTYYSVILETTYGVLTSRLSSGLLQIFEKARLYSGCSMRS